jgi:hypothetical protein
MADRMTSTMWTRDPVLQLAVVPGQQPVTRTALTDEDRAQLQFAKNLVVFVDAEGWRAALDSRPLLDELEQSSRVAIYLAQLLVIRERELHEVHGRRRTAVVHL